MKKQAATAGSMKLILSAFQNMSSPNILNKTPWSTTNFLIYIAPSCLMKTKQIFWQIYVCS